MCYICTGSALSNNHCSMSNPTYLCYCVEQAVIHAANELHLKGRYNLSSHSLSTDFCRVSAFLCYLLICTPVICSFMPLHACQSNIAFTGRSSSSCLLPRTCCFAAADDDERYAALTGYTNTSMQERGKVVCFVSVLHQGALNMGALHNGFKCLPGKMD